MGLNIETTQLLDARLMDDENENDELELEDTSLTSTWHEFFDAGAGKKSIE